MESKKDHPALSGPFGIGHYAVVILLVVSAFLIGSLYTKVQFLEKNQNSGSGNVQGTSDTKPQGKPFAEYMEEIGQDLDLDTKKLISCINDKETESLVTTDMETGTSLGVQGTPAIFINGRFLGGAFPFETFKEIIDKELAGTGSDDVKDYSQTLQGYYPNSFKPEKQEVKIGNSPAKGPAAAPVTIVEFSDFQCPFCTRVNPTIAQIMSQYQGKVKVVFKHFPLVSIHPKAQSAAVASLCASKQGKFWEFHDKLFETQEQWSNSL